MTHGLTHFNVKELVEKAQGALTLLETHGESEGHAEATQEVLRIVLENQVAIAETLDLIKIEFDKFEAGLGKIL